MRNSYRHPSSTTTVKPRHIALVIASSLLLCAQSNAQDAEKIQPTAYRVAFENDKMRVLAFHSRPTLGLCGVGMHSHPAHLTVALTEGKVRIKLPDGKTITATNASGEMFWSEAETHEVENISGRDMRALIVELKAPAVPGK